MKFLGFDGREHSVQAHDYLVYLNDTTSKSSLHTQARTLLKELFPCNAILEEVSLPVKHSTANILYADFFIPSKKILIEVHGEQHYKYNKFFYGNKVDFAKAKRRDNLKKEWCELNNIQYIELPFNESLDEWKSRFN